MGWVSTLISRRTFRAWGLVAILIVATAAIAGGIAFGNTATCLDPPPTPPTPKPTLPGSAFEIDTDANLKVDNLFGSTGCIDWLTGGSVSDPLRSGVDAQADLASGSGDNSFTQGSKEDTTDPVIESGSIPPNKSDLSWFGIYTEQDPPAPPDGFLSLFWSRVQDPSGTTNMDFELNKLFCGTGAPASNCSANGVTPKRSVGDILITYDLSRGGTVATISIRRWTAGGVWGAAQTLNNTDARGTINTTRIDSSPLTTTQNPTGSLDPRTFGEAAVSFNALFGGQGQCGSFGSAYLKSRSSDSFTAALKDFVPPKRVNISNCPTNITTTLSSGNGAHVPVGSSVHDTATLEGETADAGGTVTYTVYSDNQCTQNARDAGTVNVTNGNVPDSNSLQFNSVGTFYWQAVYSGDPNNAGDTSACTDEVVTVQDTSTVTTAQKWLPQDTAHVTLTSGGNPAGTVTFKLYNNGTCTDPVAATFADRPITNGDAETNNTTYETTAKTISWKATFNPPDGSGVIGSDGPCETMTVSTIDNDITSP